MVLGVIFWNAFSFQNTTRSCEKRAGQGRDTGRTLLGLGGTPDGADEAELRPGMEIYAYSTLSSKNTPSEHKFSKYLDFPTFYKKKHITCDETPILNHTTI